MRLDNVLINFTVVLYNFDVDVFKENVVMGNDALMKCQIPSLVADLVSVYSWQDSQGNEFIYRTTVGNNGLLDAA